MSLSVFANALATIIQLLGVYRQERATSEAATIDDYLEWLRRHNHDQLVELLTSNADTMQSIQKLLLVHKDELLGHISELNKLIVGIAARLHGLNPLVAAADVEPLLSDQAIDVLRQMNAANASRFLATSGVSFGHKYIFLRPARGEVAFTETRFIDDDLKTLCEYSLLRLDYSAKGEPIYQITRPGAKLGEQPATEDSKLSKSNQTD